jgi:hypothetical protein
VWQAREASVRFLRTAFEPDDWIAVLLKKHDTGSVIQRIGPLAWIASPRFQAWLRAMNAQGFSVYVSVNSLTPGRRARTRDAVRAVRHVFLDADREIERALSTITTRPDLPEPSALVHSSPARVHVLWRVRGFTTDDVEMLQRRLAQEVGTDASATSSAQLTRLPGFRNRKYTRAPLVTVLESLRSYQRNDFPPSSGCAPLPRSLRVTSASVRRVPVLARARRYIEAIPPAIAGRGGDLATFRVCCRLTRGFELDDDEALTVIQQWNQRCEPPWTAAELRVKLRSARRSGHEPPGGLLADWGRPQGPGQQ